MSRVAQHKDANKRKEPLLKERLFSCKNYLRRFAVLRFAVFLTAFLTDFLAAFFFAAIGLYVK